MFTTTMRMVAQTQSVSSRPQFDRARLVDIAIASIALIFFAPLMLFLALAVRLCDKGPIFFVQRRVGFGGVEFRCFKFRTMVMDADARLAALLDADPVARAEWLVDRKLRRDPRVTLAGSFLRKTSLDELPQLFNVLNGSMSIVGPRPIVAAEIALYGRWFEDYAKVRPGITGLWQVSGRNDTSYRRRVAMDVMYVRRKRLRLNGEILLRTVPAVLLQRGSY